MERNPWEPIVENEGTRPKDEKAVHADVFGSEKGPDSQAFAHETEAVPVRGSRPRRRVRATEIALVAISLAILVLLASILGAFAGIGRTFQGLLAPAATSTNPPENSFSVIRIQGDITETSQDSLGVNNPPYLHRATVDYIKSLVDNENDKGILLYMNTPGGGVYESDEVYRALRHYHEETGRPIWVYMAQNCASGGYYISVAGQHLVANYNTVTGSIGVYIALSDLSGLYEKLGIETVLVRSGEHKGTGVAGVEITEAQREVYQSTVDESYERFLEIIAEGRGMEKAAVRQLGDGRIFTANQALEAGLIDDLGDWEETLLNFEEETGASAFYPSFSRQTQLGRLLSSIRGSLPQGEAEAVLSRVEELPTGVPLAYAYAPAA